MEEKMTLTQWAIGLWLPGVEGGFKKKKKQWGNKSGESRGYVRDLGVYRGGRRGSIIGW